MRLLKRFKGVSYVEAAIALPVFILVAIVTIDLAWYVTAYIFFSYGAQRAVDLASKYVIEVPTTAGACSTNNQACTDYVNRVQAITAKATQIALSIATPPGTPSKVELIPFQHYNALTYSTGQNNSGLTTQIYNVGFFRPGEKITRDPNNSFGLMADQDHPTRPFGTAAGQGWPNPSFNEDWEDVCRSNPL